MQARHAGWLTPDAVVGKDPKPSEAIIGGLLASGFPPSQLAVSEPSRERAKYLKRTFPLIVHATDNAAAVRGGGKGKRADVVILAVKPGVVPEVVKELALEVERARALVVSIAAGIRTFDLSQWLVGGWSSKEDEPAIIRGMPNTPALVQRGTTGLYATPAVTPAQRFLAATILEAVSEVVWVADEDQLDVVTGVSGSGPAYFFLFLEALEEAGVCAGLSREVAARLAVTTCAGAAKLAIESPDSFAELRRKVTSPNGTTHAGIKVLTEGGLVDLVARAVSAAKKRSHEIGLAYGKAKL